MNLLRQFYLDQPNEISLETLAKCNAACTFCPYPTMERQGDRMSDDLIDRLVGEMAAFRLPFLFSPFKVNEPLLDVRTIPLLERMNREVSRARLRIFTNGHPLTPEKIAAIGKLRNVEHLWISLNEYRSEEYQKLMGLPFERVVKRLDDLHASDFPHPVMLSCVGYPNEDFRYWCWQRWPNFQSMAIRKTGWLGEIDPQEYPIPSGQCSRWFELSIMANGVVSLCCMDSEGKYALGDLKTHSLLEIYNQPLLRERRERVLSRAGVTPCAGCNY